MAAPRRFGALLLVALIEYFMPENGVDGTLGALIVVGSTR